MKKRSLVLMILFSVITGGIYGIYWYCSFQNQLKQKTGEGFSGLGHFLVSLVTFGIYTIYWNYAAGKRLQKLGATDNSIIYLIFSIIGLGGINALIMQSQANNLA